MLTFFQHVFVLLARVFLSLFFLWTGLMIICDWTTHRDLLSHLGAWMAVPVLITEIVFLILGGVLLMVGFRGRLAAGVLIIFLLADTLVLQGDWSWVSEVSLSELTAQEEQITPLLQNLGILGGLLMVLGFGSGGFSLDLFLRGRKKKVVE
ncbi:MAG: DoxX family protein [Planctomycetota bacterium]|jgi:putative oxidoreductase